MSGPYFRTVLLSPDLSGNPTATAWQFGGALRLEGHDVQIAGPASGQLWTPLREELADAVVLPGRWGAVRVPEGADALARKADVVYAFKAVPASFGLGLRLAGRHGLPLALHLDDWDAGFLRGGRRARRLWWAARSLANPDNELWLRAMELLVPRAHFLTVSTTALQRRFGGTLVPQGLDTRRFDPARYPREAARSRLGVGPDEPMVLFLGTPRLHKGLAGLLTGGSVAEALWIVGMRQGASAELGLDPDLLQRVRVRPEIPYAEAAWYIAAADVFVVPQMDTPYAAHQLPAKILNAMALGAAVVTTDVGDARRILGGEPPAGVVVPADDPEEFFSAVRSLLDDAERRRALGAEARRRAVEGYSWEAMGRTLSALLGGL